MADLRKLVIDRQKALEMRRAPHDPLWTDVMENVMPIYDDILQQRPHGRRKGRKIWDGTPTYALGVFQASMSGYMVSQAFPWMTPYIRQDWINDIYEIGKFLDESAEQIYGALNDSNFYDAILSFFGTLGAIGNSPLYVEEDISAGRLMFSQWQPGTVYIMTDGYGKVDGVHCKKKMTRREILKKLKDDPEATLPESFMKLAESQPFEEEEVIHAIFPREEYNPGRIDNKNKPWASVWILTGHKQHMIKESGYSKFPVFYGRYYSDGYSEYAYGPGSLALADIMGLHEKQKDIAKRAKKELDLPVEMIGDMDRKVNLSARGVTYTNRGQQSIYPINNMGNVSLTLEHLQDARQIVRRNFHVDSFLMLAAQDSGKERTATEIIELQGEKAIVLGAAIGAIQRDVLNPILDYIWDIETAAGRMPQPPDQLLELAATGQVDRIDYSYNGPLAQAQRRLFQGRGITQVLQMLPVYAEMFPSILHEIDATQMFREHAQAEGAPTKIFNSPEVAEALRAEEARQLQQQQAAENLPGLAKSAKDLSGIDASGGMPGNIAEAMGGAGNVQP